MSEMILTTGSELVVKAAADLGVSLMFGYPITPATEILELWVDLCQTNKDYQYLQTEDEIAAGFGVCGSVLAGKAAFAASAGPGNILMQDAISMAESMRLPFVGIMVGRGGPSTGTVIYSQQEVILTTHGGNGEGLRIVYSPGNLNELYEMTQKAFEAAWKYRFPAFVLTDGYLCKTKQNIPLRRNYHHLKSERIAKGAMRNCYNLEEELYDKLQKDFDDFKKVGSIAEAEEYELDGAKTIIVAHGIVGLAAKAAVIAMREQGKAIGLFRPKTLSPFPAEPLFRRLRNCQKIIFVESAQGQLEMITRSKVKISCETRNYFKPALGITSEELVDFFQKERLE